MLLDNLPWCRGSVQHGALWEGMSMLCNAETRATENVLGNADIRHHCSIQERLKIYIGDMMLKLSVCFACMQKFGVYEKQKSFPLSWCGYQVNQVAYSCGLLQSGGNIKIIPYTQCLTELRGIMIKIRIINVWFSTIMPLRNALSHVGSCALNVVQNVLHLAQSDKMHYLIIFIKFTNKACGHWGLVSVHIYLWALNAGTAYFVINLPFIQAQFSSHPWHALL